VGGEGQERKKKGGEKGEEGRGKETGNAPQTRTRSSDKRKEKDKSRERRRRVLLEREGRSGGREK
jgi:hypothetical protein